MALSTHTVRRELASEGAVIKKKLIFLTTVPPDESARSIYCVKSITNTEGEKTVLGPRHSPKTVGGRPTFSV